MNEEVIKEIFKKQDIILSKIERESIDVYLYLKKEFEKGDVKNNLVFQFVFRSFYRLDNAGLSNKLKENFFELLVNKESDLEKILEELYKIPNRKDQNTIQISFATKLLHTLDNDKPIIDAEVSQVFPKIKAKTGGSKEEKIKFCLKIYEELKNIFLNLLQDEEIRKIISKFRFKFNVNRENISDIKVLDFIIWSLGKLKKEK